MEESNEGSRFRPPKSGEEESKLLNESVPKSTSYKNKWALKVFREWQMNRKVKVAVMDPGGVFKDWSKLHKVDTVTTDIANMDADTFNYWLSKFVQEVSNSKGERYPARTVYGIVCGLRRHLVESVGSEALNPLDAGDKRFCIFRRCLDAEMKDSTREGVTLRNKRDEKEAVTVEEEEMFWSAGLFGREGFKFFPEFCLPC